MIYKPTITAIALGIVSLNAQAFQDVPLRIEGMIQPSACDIQITNANVNLGAHAVTDLNQDTPSFRGQYETTMSIRCTAATRMTMTAMDWTNILTTSQQLDQTFWASHYTAGSAGPHEHNLPLTTNGKAIGGFQLVLPPGTVDGAAATLLGTNGDGNWFVADSGALRPETSISWSSDGSATPGAYTNIVQPIHILAAYHSKAEIGSLPEHADVAGSVTLYLNYI